MPKEHSRHRSRSRSRDRKKKHRSRSRSRDRREQSAHSKYSDRNSDRDVKFEEKKPSRQREFSFEDYKRDLDLLFFTDRDVIKKDTTQYNEFWKFFAKYQRKTKLWKFNRNNGFEK